MKLNLEAKTKAQQLVKEYLENNASSALADKINNGVIIEKDGKTIKNVKTLDGFMKYATEEARKLASKGENSACVEDEVVFGWAVHYFEEDGIEEKLLNEDGTQYKKPSSIATKATTAKIVPQKPAEKPQISMFDMLTNGDNSDISPAQPQNNEELEKNLTVDEETGEIIYPTEQEPEKQEQLPTVTELISDYDGKLRTDEKLESEISAIIDEPPEDELDISAIDRAVFADLYMIFGDEITIA